MLAIFRRRWAEEKKGFVLRLREVGIFGKVGDLFLEEEEVLEVVLERVEVVWSG